MNQPVQVLLFKLTVFEDKACDNDLGSSGSQELFGVFIVDAAAV